MIEWAILLIAATLVLALLNRLRSVSIMFKDEDQPQLREHKLRKELPEGQPPKQLNK